jgi:hypothetical protein
LECRVLAMKYIDGLIDQFTAQIQYLADTHALYALAAVLLVYIFIVFGRTHTGP